MSFRVRICVAGKNGDQTLHEMLTAADDHVNRGKEERKKALP